jgi:hypothetical protein
METRRLVLKKLFVLFSISATFQSCSKGLSRPFGYMNLGKLSGLLGPQTYLQDLRLLLRRDKKGLYIMSTECTYDLSPLVMVRLDNGFMFKSSFTESVYLSDGKVTSGPAKESLPYYRLQYDGVFDTEAHVTKESKSSALTSDINVFVRVSDVVAPTWRLTLP